MSSKVQTTLDISSRHCHFITEIFLRAFKGRTHVWYILRRIKTVPPRGTKLQIAKDGRGVSKYL